MKEEKNLKESEKSTPEERRKHIEKAGKTTLVRIIAHNTNNIRSNLDVFTGTISYGIMAYVGSLLERGKTKEAIIFGVLAFFAVALKHHLPPGSITEILRTPPKKVIKNVQDTFRGYKE